jgi:Zn-dependent protease
MGLISLLTNQPAAFVLLVIPLLYSVILHEMAHGWAALAFGDRTAKDAGRLTLNPLPHLDPIGSLLILLVGFGWAKPVPVNYAQLRGGKAAIVAVALAGCLTNIGLAVIFLLLLQFQPVQSNQILAAVCVIAARINIMLGAFNLLPIPPLDGSRALMPFLPVPFRTLFARLERFGLILIVALLYTGALSPATRILESLIYRAIALLVQ